MEEFFDFLFLRDPNVQFVVMGSILLGISSALVGSFLVVRKEGLVGDAVAHSVLPGIGLAFLWSGQKDTWMLLLGASLTGLIALWCIQAITKHTKIKQDAAIALVLSVFFGAGMVILTYIQQQGMGGQSGLDQFLFGKAAALIGQDVWIFSGLAFLIIVLVLTFYRGIVSISFDTSYAQIIGFPVQMLQSLLILMTLLAVITGITAVGVVLMAAMLITPSAAARYWTSRMPTLLALSAAIGGFSGWLGAFISFQAPGMPTGPWMVVTASLIAAFSLLFAPEKGLIRRFYFQKQNQRKILSENLLKTLYKLEEQRPDSHSTIDEIIRTRPQSIKQLSSSLRQLANQRLIEPLQNGYLLTQHGKDKAVRIIRRHRLWEMYLNQYLKLPEDHLHDDAEVIEHVLTPGLEAQLAEELGHPEQDPHQRPIPPLTKQHSPNREENRS